MTTFEQIGIQSELLKGIDELGFKNPMPIQEKVIPVLLKEKIDIVGLAQTGTGKTAAFGLPIIQLTDTNIRTTQALVLAPTRELCIQIAKDMKNYSKFVKNINIVTVYGGADIDRQIKALKKGAHIIVATPGRMNDLLNRRKQIDISELQIVVLDEADEMLSMGFKEELDAILDQSPSSKNTLLFSATMPKEIKQLAKHYMKEPLELSVGQQNVGADDVTHLCYSVHEKDRYLALKRIVDFNPNIYGIVFCRTREETKNVAKKLMNDGYNADALHGDLSQAQREAVMHKFRIKNLHILTATDVAARGLDVKDITHIINYNLPDESIIYIHRSGRTGRAGQKGVSVVIKNLRENFKLKQIERLLKKKFEILSIPNGNAICEKQLIRLVDRLDQIEVDHEAIDKFLPDIYKKLENLSREDLIKHFVALEFNRFLKYYKDANELKTPTERDRKRTDKPRRNDQDKRRDGRDRNNRSDRNDRRDRNDRNGRRIGKPVAEEGFTRFFMNLGSKDNLTPPELIGLVVRSTRQRNIDIGKINIMKSFSFFEVEEDYTQAVLSGFSNIDFNKRKVNVEISKNENNNDNDDVQSPNPKTRKGFKRNKKLKRY